ncbi:MAG TPA: cupin domain-containing protein [Acidothermales bacterium]
MSRHVIARASDASATEPGALFPDSDRLTRWPIVGEDAGAVHTGFGIAILQPGGFAPAHVHSFEESVFVLEGEVILQTPDAAAVLRPGDYGLVPVGVPHAWRNEGPLPARWADMLAPQPRARLAADTFRVPDLPKRPAETLDVRDPRTRSYGSFRPEHMDPRLQSQQLLAVSASMRTALLVYSGISVKMMVDSDLGAVLSTMFMVQYDADGAAGRHDHPFEETYLILDGVVDATFDDTTYRLEPGDVAWAGAGCVHGFAAQGEPVRWLETQAPQPPSRHSYRFARDWEHLSQILEEERG